MNSTFTTYKTVFSCQVVLVFSLILKTVVCYCPDDDHWNQWWSYGDGLSGVTRWGKDGNDDWRICQFGKNQSPINIQPQTLLYDPQLQPLKIETSPVNGRLRNNKRDITYFIHNASGPSVNITSGPLSYTYRLYQIKLHYGVNNSIGSEHTIDGKSFVGEIQFLAYNGDLYSNHTEAQNSPRGIAVIAVFLNIGDRDNSAFDMLSKKFYDIRLPDTCSELNGLPIGKLLPASVHHEYMTYSGSLTQPGCKETVTWVILNRPIYISYDQLKMLREVPYQEWRDSNTRPVMPLNHRTVRTNINVKKRKSKLCNMEVAKKYEVNAHVRR